MTRRPERDPVLLGLVFLGGAAGTAARAVLEDASPAGSGWPWTTFAINVAGALLLGFLLELLSLLGTDTGWRRRLRLGLGTGVLGGFTTYSTFALEVTHGRGVALSTAYAVGTVVLGFAAVWVGFWLARLIGPHHPQDVRP